MKTYEMVALAEKNGKTYKNIDMCYNFIDGFYWNNASDRIVKAVVFDGYKIGDKTDLHAFMMMENWKEAIRQLDEPIIVNINISDVANIDVHELSREIRDAITNSIINV